MQINKNVISLTKDTGIKPDQMGSILFVIECMYYEKFDLLDKFDDTNSNKNALIIYKEAEKIALLKRDKLNDKNVHFSLTYTGKKFWEQVLEASESDIFIPKKNESMSEWISDWVNLWKDENGIFYKDSTQKTLRSLGSPEKDVYEQMTAFMMRYNYIFKGYNPKEIIMGATRKYIEEFKKSRFQYCRTAYYFIMKEENKIVRSTLAQQCENYINSYGKEEEQTTSKFGYAANTDD